MVKRGPRGFAVKFYAEDGNWDVVGNSSPMFITNDPMVFPSFIRSQKRNPQTHLKNSDMFWDFLSLRPESTHQAVYLFSDIGIPDGYRHMNGYSVHAFKLINANGEHCYCKFHFQTDQGVKTLPGDKAKMLRSEDPDYAIKDLYNAISRKDYPSWTWYLQIMTPDQASKWSMNPFDITKVWPRGEFPLIPVGRMVLNRNPDNYFADVEQAAFTPAHLIPGVEPTPDKMLQARLFAYGDTQRYRLGVNYLHLPVNCPFRTRVNNSQRDGAMCFGDNQGGAPNYFPNSFNGPQCDETAAISKEYLSGVMGRFENIDNDNFSQARVFYNNVLKPDERKRVVDNIADNLKGASAFIQVRAVKNFAEVDSELGRQLTEALNLQCTSV